MNPKALPLMRAGVPRDRRPGLARDGDPRDPAERRRALRPRLAGGRRRVSEATAAAARAPAAAGRRSCTAAASAPASAGACRAIASVARDRLRDADHVRAGADAGAVLVQRLVDHLAALGGLHHPLVRRGVGDAARPRTRSSTRSLVAAVVTVGSLVARHARRLGPDPAALRAAAARSPGLHGSVLVVPWLIIGVAGLIFFSEIGVSLSLTTVGADAARGHLPARRRDHLRRPGALLALGRGGGDRPRRVAGADDPLRRPARRSRPRSPRRRSSPSPGRSTTSRSRSSPAASSRRSRSGCSRSCASRRTCRWSTRSRP